ncbi:peptide ABC transporter ATP-binding protein [Curtobacterium sp. MCJR17_055]|uniref:amino acid ABC transporter ATP-binding protein n=1 Tax=unclassified Curtobacterium TaxID=257496 RepID=UPI000D88B77D|nr:MULTISPECIES: amino acid ABC transporter ATP-binding protein [unclassified Curtobacterium]PYY32905.1 peptide ABC transporter ATP-binding protein [Curtobacterium sp. MCBD17_029]PYY52822.1 peptide ABC transporter ATP-binding protein [Curtobacterium sp. MCJR17_055]PYY56059.1 peptide ABC transporter ATP-binding protein [Curtobacterium sp. MCPF17_015]WIB35744.1 amino acid ABC transporter ATP-binding protein [Curtobacterium sp. MCJR17_043]
MTEQTAPVLELRGLRKSFGDRPVLRGIDLTVHRHEVICVIGASGSGKSTLLKTVNLLEGIDDGQVLLQGQDVSDPRVDVDATRARIGVVFQQFNLFPHMSVLDNVTLASRKVHRASRADAEATARRLLDRIGLGDFAVSYPDRLSGGQQQRVAIVRAVASDPELLLLDEVTSALDPQLVGEVLDLVTELKQQGSTILMTTHEMHFARNVADRIVFLHEGEVVEQGAPAAVLDAPQHPALRAFLARVHA